MLLYIPNVLFNRKQYCDYGDHIKINNCFSYNIPIYTTGYLQFFSDIISVKTKPKKAFIPFK